MFESNVILNRFKTGACPECKGLGLRVMLF